MPFSGLLSCVALVIIDVSEERSASIIRSDDLEAGILHKSRLSIKVRFDDNNKINSLIHVDLFVNKNNFL
jgi:hypothetical protein